MLKTIKVVILFFLILFIILGFSLFSGIKIDSFTLGNFSVSKFYLKLDKKLILETSNLEVSVTKTETHSSISDTIQLFSNLEYILNIFKKIKINRLKIGDNTFTVYLDDNQLYLDNKYINISSSMEVKENYINLAINSIYLKDNTLTLFGDVKIDKKTNIASFLGNYIYKYVEGDINVKLSEEILDFYIDSSKKIDSLGFLKDYFRLDSVAEEWMYDNVEGKIKLNYLYGKVDLEKKLPILNSIKGQAIIDDAKIRFHKDAKTVDTSKLTVNYENDTLSFDLKDPMYDQSKLYGSKVYITDLTSLEKGIVHVDLKSDSMLNEDILGILKAYEISLPIKQFSGNLKSKLLLHIPYLASKKMHVNGLFEAQNAVFKLGDFEFFANSADVVLEDNNVIIKKAHVTRDELIDADIVLNIDTKNQTATGKAKINNFSLKKDDTNIISIKDFDTDIGIDFTDKTYISIEKLNTKLFVGKQSVDIDIPEISIIYPYSQLLQNIKVKEGDIKVKVYDEENIDFIVDAQGLDYPFQKGGEKITKLKVNGIVKNGFTLIKAVNNDINILLQKGQAPTLKIKDIDLYLEGNTFSSPSTSKYPDINIELKNSSIILDAKHKYNTSWANIYIQDSKIKFEGEALDLDFPISKDGKDITTLVIDGSYDDNLLNLKTKDNKLELDYNLKNEKIKMKLDGYDVVYNTNELNENNDSISYDIKGKNSNIIINKNHIAKATNYDFKFEKNSTDINLKNNSTSFYYKKDEDGNIILDVKNMDDTFINALLGKNLVKDGSVNLFAKGKDEKIQGVVNLDNTKIIDLAILNNLIILINTTPGIINPLLAIPSVVGMATNGGFNLNGYRIINGQIDFTYDMKNKFLNMEKIKTEGNGIDFDGNMTMDFLTSKVDATLKLIFFKDYSKLVGYIPVVNYVLLGDEKRVDTEVEIYGTLDDPKYKTNLIKDGVGAPVNFFKRIINSPVDLIKSFGSGDKKEEEKKGNE